MRETTGGAQRKRTRASVARTNADFPKYSIAVAAELSGVAQHQLRRMEESGLVAPSRTEGNTRRYSDNDVAKIAEIAGLSEAGINAEGIRHVLQLQREVEALHAEVADLRQRLDALEHQPASADGHNQPRSGRSRYTRSTEHEADG